MRPFPQTQKLGFTLIELLVVVSILGLLAAVVLTGLDGAQRGALDARVTADVNNLELALQQYYMENNNQYPCMNGTTLVQDMTGGCSDITPYIDPLPETPFSVGDKRYRYLPAGGDGGAGVNRNSYTILIWLDVNGAFCHVTRPPGYTPWVTNYDACF